MSAELTDIVVRIVVGVSVSLVTTFIIPAIFSWVGNLRLAKLKTFIDNAVDASEQIFGPKTGTQKKAYVNSFIRTKCRGLIRKLKIADETLDLMVEASVARVSSAIKQAKDVSAAVAKATYDAATGNHILTETATETDNGLIVAKQEGRKYKSKGDNDSRPVSMS